MSTGKELKFDIWDTAGQERYRSLTKLFYKDANAAVLVYDITREESFNQLEIYWVKQIKENSDPNIILVLAANKSDLLEDEKVDESAARKFAEEANAIFCRVSAKNGAGIDDIFFQIAKRYVGRDDIEVKKKDNKEPINTGNEEENSKNDKMKITKGKASAQSNKRKCC